MQKLNLTLLLLLLFAGLSAQSDFTQTIKGTVIDKEAEYPLIGVTVILNTPEGQIGTTTDLDGTFKLENVPVGRRAVQFSYIGYKPVTLPAVLVKTGKEIMLEIQMEEELNNLSEVVITASKNKQKAVNEMAAVSARSMTMEEVTRFSGSLGDVSRMAQNYAGVSGASDDRNDIIVRGNSPSAVLWRLEGVDIPSPNHWSTLGTTGGPISMLNTNSLRTSDFLSSAFPAEYGNATGAVFDLKLKNGNPDKYEFLGQVGFNGFEAGVEGPLNIGKKASFSVNYRYSTLGVFQKLGIDLGTGSSVPKYQDVNFKVNIPTKKAGRFSLWGLGGLSDIVFEPEEENLFNQGSEKLSPGAKTGIVGFNHNYFFNQKTSSNFSVAFSATENYALVEELEDPENEIYERVFSSVQTQQKLGVNWMINHKMNPKNRIKAGVMLDFYDIAMEDSVKFDDDVWFSEVDFEGAASLYRGFAQWQHKFDSRWTLNAGLYSSFFGLNESITIEPRANLAFAASEKSTFAVGYGRHSQLQPLPIYFTKSRYATPEQNAANEELDLIKSDHFVVSWDYLMTPDSRIKLEAYHQSLFDMGTDPEDGDFSLANVGADFVFPNRVGLTNDGTGTNTGLELTVEQFLKKGFYGLFTASVFDSKYKGSDSEEHSTFFNSNYVFNLLAGKEFVLNEKLAITLDARVNYAGGRRYTPIDLAASMAAGEEVLDNTKVFEERYDPYFRPDFKIGLRHNSKKYSQSFSVDLQNFIGRRNIFLRSYDEDDQEITTTYQRGFFPDVRYQILF